MEELKRKVELIIQQHFHGADVSLEEIPHTKRLSGHVLWEGFDGMTALERQRELRRTLRHDLEKEEELQLSVLLTLTPAELDSIMEEAA